MTTAIAVNADNWTGREITVHVNDDCTFTVDALKGETFRIDPAPSECCDFAAVFPVFCGERKVCVVVALSDDATFSAIVDGVERCHANAFVAAAKLLMMIF